MSKEVILEQVERIGSLEFPKQVRLYEAVFTRVHEGKDKDYITILENMILSNKLYVYQLKQIIKYCQTGIFQLDSDPLWEKSDEDETDYLELEGLENFHTISMKEKPYSKVRTINGWDGH